MSPRLQRVLLLILLIYFMLFGGTLFTQLNAVPRAFHQVFTLIVFAIWLVDLWRTGRVFPATPLDRPILAYMIVVLLAALFSQDPRISLGSVWAMARNVLGFYLLVDLLRRGRQRWLMESLFLVSTVAVLITALEAYAWLNGLGLVGGLTPFEQSWPEIGLGTLLPLTHKFGLAFGISTQLGNHTATMIPLVIAWALTIRRRDLRTGAWLLALALGVALLLSESRGGLVALGAGLGVLIVAWLLRDDTRARFPAMLRPLLNRKVVLGGSVLAGVILLGGTFFFTVINPRSGDANRLDLWRSALEMTADHPLLGVGPNQFGAMLRYYGSPELSASQERISHAHNLALNTLAETGVAGLGVMLWFVATFLIVWWRAWQRGSPGQRRRLEGGLAALAAFGAHNLVDSLAKTGLLIPVMLIIAYTVAGDVTRVQAITEKVRITPGRRGPIFVVLAVLLILQGAYVPLYGADLHYERGLRAMREGEYLEALSAVHEARALDPAMDLYPLQQAHILGLLANENTEIFLPVAIAAHQEALALNPTWDNGWHNLAALYAQQEDYEAAVSAEGTAIEWNPVPAGYHFKLGEYYEALGLIEDAQTAYTEALRREADLAASVFWTDSAHPERAAILADMIRAFTEEYPPSGLRVALSSGDLDSAVAIAAILAPEPSDLGNVPYWTLRDLGYLASRMGGDPTLYYGEAVERSRPDPWVDYAALAELALDGDGMAHPLDMTAEQSARYALFLAERRNGRGWHTLAQLAADSGAPDAEVNALLYRALPSEPPQARFSLPAYGRQSALDILPQALAPSPPGPGGYDPLLWLIERLEAANDSEALRDVYERALLLDPYWDAMRERLEALPDEG